MPTSCWLKHVCSIRALVPVSFFLSIPFFCLSLSLYFWLIPWRVQARWAHFLAWLLRPSREGTVPSPTREGARCLRAATRALRTGLYWLSAQNRGYQPLSLLLSYHQLWTTRFWSIKGPTESNRSEAHFREKWKYISWRRKWQPTPIFLPGESLVDYSLWGHRESETTERLTYTHKIDLIFNVCGGIWRTP